MHTSHNNLGNNDAICWTLHLVHIFSAWQPLSCAFMTPGSMVVACNMAGRKELGMHCKWPLSKVGCIGHWRIQGSCGMMLLRMWDSWMEGVPWCEWVSTCHVPQSNRATWNWNLSPVQQYLGLGWGTIHPINFKFNFQYGPWHPQNNSWLLITYRNYVLCNVIWSIYNIWWSENALGLWIALS